MIEPGRSKGQRPEAVFRVSSKERTLELVHRFRTKEELFFLLSVPLFPVACSARLRGLLSCCRESVFISNARPNISFAPRVVMNVLSQINSIDQQNADVSCCPRHMHAPRDSRATRQKTAPWEGSTALIAGRFTLMHPTLFKYIRVCT